MRDIFAGLLAIVWPDVTIEPLLAPFQAEVFTAASTITASDTRSAIRVLRVWGFWTRAQNVLNFIDARVFHTDAAPYASRNISALFLQHERQKKLQYNEEIVHVHLSKFTPLVFSTTGRTSHECFLSACVACWQSMTANLMGKWCLTCNVSYPLRYFAKPSYA